MHKDFDGWHQLKKQINDAEPPLFKERDIWWCCIGINVGDEMDGKNTCFERPVLVLRKFNRNIFYGLPLSTQLKNNRYYLPIELKGRQQSVLISQMRLLEAKRLTDRMGRLAEVEFEKVRQALKALI